MIFRSFYWWKLFVERNQRLIKSFAMSIVCKWCPNRSLIEWSDDSSRVSGQYSRCGFARTLTARSTQLSMLSTIDRIRVGSKALTSRCDVLWVLALLRYSLDCIRAMDSTTIPLNSSLLNHKFSDTTHTLVGLYLFIIGLILTDIDLNYRDFRLQKTHSDDHRQG